jgi:hypothetical protein
MGKSEKNRKENHETKVTKIPKTKTRKYGLNETYIPPFLDSFIYFIKRRIFAQNDKFSNKNDLVSEWRDFNKKIEVYVQVHMIKDTLSHKFHPYVFDFQLVNDG